MKIVYCVYQLGVGGGIERVLTTKVNWLVSHGHEVEIITCDYDGRPTAYGIDPSVKITDFAIDYAEDFRVPLFRRAVNTVRKMRKHRKLMEAYLAESAPDIVVTTHLVEMSFLPRLKDGSKKVLELHSTAKMYLQEKNPKPYSLRRLLVWLYELRDRYSLSRFDAVGCLTYEDMALRGSPRNMQVVANPNPFSTDCKGGKKECSPANNIVLAVGSHLPAKNFSGLVDVWSRVAPNFPSWRLHIVGDGYLRPALERKIEELNLSEYITLIPHNNNIVEHYLSADVYAFTSKFEGMPMVLIEAMSFGLPVVAYACPCGPRDIIADGVDGYLVSPDDIDTFSKRLEVLMENSDLRHSMGEKASESVQRFSLEPIMNQWMNLFNDLLKR